MLVDSCIFCKIIRGAIPSYKILDTPLVYGFLDINPLSKGHVLLVPKYHGAKLHDIPDENLAALLPAAKKIVVALGEEGGLAYNILQNNGRLAHQEVDHVHVHVIPKRTADEGLGINWSPKTLPKEELLELAESLQTKMQPAAQC